MTHDTSDRRCSCGELLVCPAQSEETPNPTIDALRQHGDEAVERYRASTAQLDWEDRNL